MRALVEQFDADFGSLSRFYSVPSSKSRHERLTAYYAEWATKLEEIDFGRLDRSGKVDFVLLESLVARQGRRLRASAKELAEAGHLLTFAETIVGLEEARRRLEPVDAEQAAGILAELAKKLGELQKRAETEPKPPKHIANRAAGVVESLRGTLRGWFGFYNGYDPLFTWWASEPHKAADKALADYFNFLKEKLVGVKPDDPNAIIGNPIGRDALIDELRGEMIVYSPDELVEIANREFAWCDAEMRKASRNLGFGDDWKKALEHVKDLHVEPGKQPHLIQDLAREAIEFVEKRDLVTIPPLAKETWRMEMMSPERQLVSPFFLGGEAIIVSFPTNTMQHDQKLMSMRGNNVHFSRATVQHELIPGHHLQGFMNARNMTHRRVLGTPFWTEGWALYWEMLLWDLGFPKTPEDRVGMLFWRMHRCARIIFSLGFHLGNMSPQECIDFLVDRVGHERANAEAEVRRSFAGTYGPLYQAAYMLGGLQFRSLHRELVGSGKMTNRQFHDAILRENAMPVEIVRAILTNASLGRGYRPSWRFADPIPGAK